MRVRYTQWDGSQAVRLDAAQVFEKLAEYLVWTDDVQQALDALLRRGAGLDAGQVAGLDELLDRVRRERLDLHERFHLERSLDAPRRCSDGQPATADDVVAVERFRDRNRDRFRGPQALDFAATLDLTRQLDRLARLEAQIEAGDPDEVDLDVLGETLGPEAAADLAALRRMVAELRRSGTVRQRGGRTTLSPQGVRRLGRLALRDIYRGLQRDRSGGHVTEHRGATQLRPERSRPWSFGAPLHLDLVATLRNALARGGGVPLALAPDDFAVFDTDRSAGCATVLLLDMSWSMSREGRFAAAKKVAMALETLVRTKYPRDFFAVAGFHTRAVAIAAGDLPEARCDVGDPFTNLQDGLRLATRLLERQPTPNRQVIVVTDGQPTAYFAGERLYCEMPLSAGSLGQRAAHETLKEVKRVARTGITLNTFMLDDSPSLLGFVERMTRIGRGRALYTRPDRLGAYLLVDWLGRRRWRG